MERSLLKWYLTRDSKLARLDTYSQYCIEKDNTLLVQMFYSWSKHGFVTENN